MCTLTYFIQDETLLVGFNRDEQLSRKSGIPPALYEESGVRYLSPRDGQSNGTWIGVNEFGIVVCLLNYYDKTPPGANSRSYESRGLLVNTMLRMESLENLEKLLKKMQLSLYLPFRLVVLTLKQVGLQVAWDGSELLFEPCEDLVVSSSFDVGACRLSRGQVYRDFDWGSAPSMESIVRFHSSHLLEKGPLSVCVHRPDVETVSFTGITLTSDKAEMVYTTGSPCTTGLGAPVSIKI